MLLSVDKAAFSIALSLSDSSLIDGMLFNQIEVDFLVYDFDS